MRMGPAGPILVSYDRSEIDLDGDALLHCKIDDSRSNSQILQSHACAIENRQLIIAGTTWVGLVDDGPQLVNITLGHEALPDCVLRLTDTDRLRHLIGENGRPREKLPLRLPVCLWCRSPYRRCEGHCRHAHPSGTGRMPR